MKLQGLDHIALGVPDLDAAVRWYCDVLGLERQHASSWGDYPSFVGKGETGIAFFPAEKKGGTAAGSAPLLHFAFRADRAGFVRAQSALKERGIGWHFQDHGISHSIYFHDLNGLELEITTYEV